MIVERTYHKCELEHGECNLCGEVSDEIIPEEGICVDCYESELFYKETMKGI